MTTVEKLLVQLCERKHSIIDLVKQQTESYSQHLACEFLIDGITPPSWLLDPDTSGSKELSKEDLISKILRPYPRPSVCCSVAHYPGYTNLVITGDNEELSDGDFVQNPAFNKDLDRKNYLTTPGFSGQHHGEGVLNKVPELDASVASPEDQTDGSILNIYTAPDQSLAGIQRSKSRQKALELRSSAKAPAKSDLRHESISDVVSSQIRFSLSTTNQPGRNDELSQSAEPHVIGSQSCEERNVFEAHCLSRETGVDTYSERKTRSGSYAEVPIPVGGSFPLSCSPENYKEKASSQDARAKRTESMPILGSENSDNLYKRSPKSAEPSAVCDQSFRDMKVKDADFLCENEETNVCTGETTRSGVSSKRQSCGDYLGIDITMMDYGDQPPDCIDGSLVQVNLSSDCNEGCDARESVIEDFGRHIERGPFPPSRSIQRNTCVDEITNLEVSSVSAKVHGGILALSSAGSARQVNTSQKQSGLGKPSVGFLRRLTRSQTRFYNKETYHPVTDNENPSLEGRKPISDCEEKSSEELQTTSSFQSVPPCLGTHNMLHEGCEARESALEDFERHKGRESALEDFERHNGRDTFPSPSSIQRNACIHEISNLEVPSVSAKAQGGILVLSSARPARQVSDSEELSGLGKQSVGLFPSQTRSQTRSYDKETCHPVTDNENPSFEGTKSISHCEEKSAEEPQTKSSGQSVPPCLGTHNMLHDESGKLVMASELVLLDHVDQSCLSGSTYSRQRRGLESEVALTPSDYCAFVEPKRLEFLETDGYNLKAFTSKSGNRSLDNLSQKMRCSLHASDVSLVKGICGGNNLPSSSEQLLGMSDVSTEEDNAHRDSFEPVLRESPDSHAENFGPVVDSAILSDFKDSTEAELNFGSSEVQDEADNLLSKMVDITGIQSPKVKLHVKHGFESSLVEQGDCGDEGRDKGQLVSIVPERKNSRLSYVYSSADDDSVVQSYGCSIKKAGKNPIAINEIKQYTAQQSQMLPEPVGDVFNEHGDSSLGSKSFERPSTVRLQGKNSSLARIFTHARTESWPQAKRRKIELQQTHSFTTSQCFRVAKPHSFQRDPGNMYLKTMEVDVDTGLMEHVNMSMDDGICSEVNTDRVEVIQSAILSQHGEVGSGYVKMNEHKNTSPVTNNDQLDSTISSLAMKESRNSQRCLIEGTRTSPSSYDNLDSRTSGDKQCSEQLCNLENDGDNLNTENLDLSSTLYKETQIPKWEDGLHVHHSVLSSSNEDLQLTDVDQSMSVFEDGLHVHHSVLSSSNEDLQLSDVDQSMPVFEGFNVNTPADTGELDFAADGFDLGNLELPRTTLERASVLAEICRSASLDRPSSHFTSAFKFQETWNLCKSVPDDDHLEHIESGNIHPLNPDVWIHFQSRSSSTDDYKDAVDGMPYSVPLAYSGERYGWNSRNQLSSPVGKLWDQLSSHTGSSGKCSSSNPELTCFPIEEDPSSSEDNKIMKENAGDTQDETESSLAKHSDKRQPLEDLTNIGKSSAEEVTLIADSLDFLTSKLSVTRTQDKALLGPKYQCRKKSETREKQTSSIGAIDGRKHQLSSIAPNAIKKAKQSVNNSTRKSMRNKISKTTSLKEQDQKLSLTESRRNNIVSNVSSFIPLVQQKQAATDCTGKRDVKVKALEAAEAAKRLEERKENERKMRKEALKIERAKLEEKNLRDIVLEKKKKEEERKKKDADIIAKKRLREEEERKEREKKRMRVEARQRQREQEEKKRAERPEKENQRTKIDAQMNSKKEFNNESKWQQNRETTKGEGMTLQKTQTNLTLNEVVVNSEECGISGLSCEAGEARDAVDKTPRKEDLLVQKGKSYEISPYQCSEDEDEGDDELPTKKYIPSWASKSSIALFLPLQQELDPDVIFPPDRFCSMDAVLLPRKLRQQQAAT